MTNRRHRHVGASHSEALVVVGFVGTALGTGFAVLGQNAWTNGPTPVPDASVSISNAVCDRSSKIPIVRIASLVAAFRALDGGPAIDDPFPVEEFSGFRVSLEIEPSSCFLQAKSVTVVASAASSVGSDRRIVMRREDHDLARTTSAER
jgi:hypothetical protein